MLSIDKNNRITLTRGDYAEIEVSITDVNGQAYEAASGDRLVLTVKKSVGDSEPAIRIETTVTEGKFVLNGSDTKSLDFGGYVYDVQLIAGGRVFTIVPCTQFTIDEEVGGE